MNSNIVHLIGSTDFIVQISISCYQLPVIPNKSNALFIGLLVGGVIFIVIIITGISIYALRMRKFVNIERRKTEISQSILNDFG